MSRKGLVSLVVSLLVSLLVSREMAYAHERWFVQHGRHAGEQVATGSPNLLLILGGIAFLLFAFVIHRARVADRVRAMIDGARHRLPDGIEWRLVAMLSGLMLITNAFWGVFLAPEFVLPRPGLVLFGGVGQAVIGALLISQLSFFLSGVLILVVAVPTAAVYFGADFMVHYSLEFIALGLALALVGLSSGCRDLVAERVGRWLTREPRDLAHLPLPVIRIGLGLTFTALALHCKLIDPNIALTFLDLHDLNFVRQLGFTGFTNPQFVFAACVGETTLGLTLAFGIATRFVAAILLTALLGTLVILGPVELVGHLPIMAIVLLLLYRGAGSFSVPQTLFALQPSSPRLSA